MIATHRAKRPALYSMWWPSGNQAQAVGFMESMYKQPMRSAAIGATSFARSAICPFLVYEAISAFSLEVGGFWPA